MLNPHAVVDALFANAATAPARIQPLAADDVDYFVEACRCVNLPFFLLVCCARTSDQWSSSTRWETVDSRAHRQRGRKPAPFIPVIDAELQFWFKKDSLWQSEMLDAVVDSDVGRVAILQVVDYLVTYSYSYEWSSQAALHWPKLHPKLLNAGPSLSSVLAHAQPARERSARRHP